MKTEFKFNKGDKVGDIITDFKGIVTGNVDYITGCKQCLVSPKKGDAQWFDEDRLEIISINCIKINVKNPGFGEQAPIK